MKSARFDICLMPNGHLNNVLSCQHASRTRFQLLPDEKVDGEGLPSSLLQKIVPLLCSASVFFARSLFPIWTQSRTCLQPSF